MSANIVEVRNLRKDFDDTTAVHDLSFEVKQGEILGFLGVNGAGKTTTIFMLLGLITPSQGTITIFGRNMQKDRVAILRRMNFASAYQFLPYNLKVWENLFVFAEIYAIKQGKAKIDELLDLFELSHLANSITGMLSSGEQTRLNLCKALLSDPELLLLDEPTASLDPDQADKVRKILLSRQQQSGMTIINTSHNMADVHAMCNRILFMRKGQVVAQGDATEVMKQFDSQSLEEVFITIARTPALEAI